MTPDQVFHVLREARFASGRSQRELAAAVGVHQSMISDWERGLVQPRITSVLHWARALGYRLTLDLVSTGGEAARVAPPNPSVDLPEVPDVS